MGTAFPPNSAGVPRWGLPPWTIDFHSGQQALPEEVEFAVVGGGFTGLAAAAWLRHSEPNKSVALFECSRVGAGSSGHTGGMALSESAAGSLPGLGDVLAGFSAILRDLEVQCDLALSGALEIGRQGLMPNSPITWNDSGTLGVTREVPGGTIDPGKMLTGLAQAASKRGVLIFENAPVENLSLEESPALTIHGKPLRARSVLLATNAESLGLAQRKPFYTVDLPYLWGRVFHENRVIFGSGLVHVEDWRELLILDVAQGRAAELLADLERRVRDLHPALRGVRLSHRWGGPILIAENWKPVFRRHAKHHNVLVLGAYSGHGVALSVYLGAWAAEAMLGKRDLPQWEDEANAAD